MRAIGDVSKLLNQPVVSIDSGNAMFESAIVRAGIVDNIICVDPNPADYVKGEVFIKPNHATAHELVKKNDDIVGNCVMLLVRPTPTGVYDIEAIQLLRPRAIFIMYCHDGADGSVPLHQFMSVCGLPNQFTAGLCKDTHPNYLTNMNLPGYSSNSIHFTNLVADATDVQMPTCALMTRGAKLISVCLNLPSGK